MQVTHTPSRIDWLPVTTEAFITITLTEAEAKHYANLIGGSYPASRKRAFGEDSDSDILVDIYRAIRKIL
jgi:hypothetical protein